LSFARVLTGPLQRTRKTCELAGRGSAAELDLDLVEWDYGQYEGLGLLRSAPNDLTGIYSGTAARLEKARSRPPLGRIESLPE